MGRTKKQPPLVLRDTYSSINDFIADSPYWENDGVQAAPGRIHIDRLRFFTDELWIAQTSFNAKIVFRATMTEGHRNFFLASATDQNPKCYRQEIGDNQIVIAPDTCDLDGVVYPGTTVTAISIPARNVAELAAEVGVPDFPERSVDGLVATPPGKPFRQLRDTLRRMDERAVEGGDTSWVHELGASLKSTLMECLASTRDFSILPTSQRRDTAVQLALDHIETHLENTLTIKDLCAAANVSERTLLYAFRDRLDVTPKEYLQSRRMQMVNRDLLTGRALNVTEAATRWGFWHMSQFAADYRRMFGERPSDTFRKGLKNR